MLAAMIEAQVRSPRTTAICGSGGRADADLSAPRHHRVAHRARHALVPPQHWSHCIETSEPWRWMPQSLQRSGFFARPSPRPSPLRGEGELLDRFLSPCVACLCFWFFFADQAAAFSDAGFFAYLAAQVVQAALADVSVAPDVALVAAR